MDSWTYGYSFQRDEDREEFAVDGEPVPDLSDPAGNRIEALIANLQDRLDAYHARREADPLQLR